MSHSEIECSKWENNLHWTFSTFYWIEFNNIRAWIAQKKKNHQHLNIVCMIKVEKSHHSYELYTKNILINRLTICCVQNLCVECHRLRFIFQELTKMSQQFSTQVITYALIVGVFIVVVVGNAMKWKLYQLKVCSERWKSY